MFLGAWWTLAERLWPEVWLLGHAKAWHPPDGFRGCPGEWGSAGVTALPAGIGWVGVRGVARPAAVPVFLSPRPSLSTSPVPSSVLAGDIGAVRPPPGPLRPEQTSKVSATRQAVLGQTGL